MTDEQNSEQVVRLTALLGSRGGMDAGVEEGGQPQQRHAKHIKKRALRNKALSVSFNEKDLRFS